MTDAQKYMHEPFPESLASTSRDLGLELLGLRVNGAQLGTILGVSRQAVSRAVHRGTISKPGVDGLFDARRAVREWMANTDPARVRARALKPGVEAVSELRVRMQELQAEVVRLRAEVASEREWSDKREEAVKYRVEDAAARRLCKFTNAILERFTEMTSAQTAGRLDRWLDELIAVEYYGHDLAEFRADFPEGDEDI